MYESFMMFQHIMKRSVEVKSVAALFKLCVSGCQHTFRNAFTVAMDGVYGVHYDSDKHV